MTKYELRSCCRTGSGAFCSTPDAPRDVDRSGAELPIVATLPKPPKPRPDVAHHEAAHAVAYHSFGGTVKSVTIIGQPQVMGADDPPDLGDRLIMLLAGPAATDAYFRTQRTLLHEELADYTVRVDDVVFGNCDHCRAVLVATVIANKTGADRVEIFREGERRANEFVRLPNVKSAIRSLAAALMREHTLTGAEAHGLISQYIEFGELANAEESKKAA